MDFDKKKLESAGVVSAELKRCCSDCRTTKTPLWRGGPQGPKSLCNACGIRYRKKRRALLGLKKREKENKEEDERRENNKGGVSWTLAEEEEAAVLLMALSYGFVSAA